MAKKRNPVEAAAGRIAILREIVNRERQRAESKPDDARNLEFGLTEEGQTRAEARERIAEVFDELGYLLDHLNIAHMAASFEAAAMARLTTVVGESRSAIERARKAGGRWPANLVRGMNSFEGLHDIGAVMALDPEMQAMFSAIRQVRNAFGHAPKLDGPPIVTGSDAQDTLLDMLAMLR